MFKSVSYKFHHGISVVVTGPSPPVRPEEVDRTLQRQDNGVESALLYAKAWSKYTKELLAWVEKRLSAGESGVEPTQLSSTCQAKTPFACDGPCALHFTASLFFWAVVCQAVFYTRFHRPFNICRNSDYISFIVVTRHDED